MKLTTSGNIKPTPALRNKLNLVSKKIKAQHVHATLSKSNREQIARISVVTPSGFFTANQSTFSLYDSIEYAGSKLKRQMMKAKTRQKRNRRLGAYDKEFHLNEWIIDDPYEEDLNTYE